MFYLATALYWEAEPFIRHFGLKKDVSFQKIQVFSNEEMCLMITGVGAVSAAASIAMVCTAISPGKEDFLMNIGICGAKKERAKVGDIFCCHKIKEEGTQRYFYPDMLYRHPFLEGTLLTCQGEKTFEEIQKEPECFLFDREASGVFQSGLFFFSAHQIFMVKIVSDYGHTREVTPQMVKGQIEKGIKPIEKFLEGLRFCEKEKEKKEAPMSDWKKLVSDLHCSAAMEASLRQYARYCELSGVDFWGKAASFYQEGKLPCENKKKGKSCFEEFKRQLL